MDNSQEIKVSYTDTIVNLHNKKTKHNVRILLKRKLYYFYVYIHEQVFMCIVNLLKA